jgi:hypothetical protein
MVKLCLAVEKSTLSCKIGDFLYNDMILLTKTTILAVK